MINWAVTVLDILVILFGFFVGFAVLTAVVFYLIDRFQVTHTIRRNYPLIGRFRYFFERLGEFFRQYFFAMDREELPFNRAQRSWAYRAAKDLDNTVAFGSTKDNRVTGSLFFLNCPFPTLEKDAMASSPLLIGPYAKNPYYAPSFFNISGTSYGAISKPALQALTYGAKKAGCWLNTGEGGLSEYHLKAGCDIVFQIGTAKYGVRDEQGHLCDKRLVDIAAYSQVRMFELKLSQGAKPGKGGILPAIKVTEEIAKIRGIPVAQDSISPNRHLDINSVEDLLDRIEHIRTVTGKPVGIKFVLGTDDWLEALCHAIAQRGEKSAPDFITLDGSEGGTGASPMPLIDDVGLPLQQSLPILVNLLIKHHLKERIRLIVSGKLITPDRVAWALAMGADFVNSARGFMFALGCIQALQCNKNTCPTGITTHNQKLQRGLVPKEKSERVYAYHKNMIKEVSIIAHSCGVTEPRGLKPMHVKVLLEEGRSKTLEELYFNT